MVETTNYSPKSFAYTINADLPTYAQYVTIIPQQATKSVVKNLLNPIARVVQSRGTSRKQLPNYLITQLPNYLITKLPITQAA
jgi:hypothetical protein